jgi:hypothetical protein
MIRLSEDPINPTSIRAIEDLFSEAEFKAKVRRFPPKIISGMLLPALSKIPVKFADFEALRLAAKTSVAIEKYRRSHARHAPEALSNAVGPIPLDPYDGQPLRYRKLGIGYTIYSVGADREDNQGRAKPLKSPFHHWDVAFSVAR